MFPLFSVTEDLPDRGERLGINTHWTKFHCADLENHKQRQQEDVRPDEVNLSKLDGQILTPWQTVRREETAYTDAIPSCGNGMATLWIPRTWTV